MIAVDTATDSTRRDRWGRYLVVPPCESLVVPPGERKAVGYTRVTTIAKALDSEAGLTPWKATLATVGTLRRPGIAAKWQQLLAAHPDPWYDTDESKAQCKALVEEAAQAGGSSDRADIGTALHSFLEAWLRGQPSMLLDPTMAADLAAAQQLIADHGLIIDPNYVEAMVVLDEYRVAGRADALHCIHPTLGACVLDLKTGANLTYSWQAIAVQLAAYANADNIYRQGATAADDERLPMPTISRTTGLVLHLPAGQATASLHTVDLEAGWDAFQLAIKVRSWRSTKPQQIAAPVTSPTVEPAATGKGGAPADPALPVALPTPAEQRAAIPTNPDEGPPITDADYEALRGRYMALGKPTRTVTYARLVEQAMQAGVSFHLSDGRTVRRFEIARGLVLLAAHDSLDDDTVRALLHTDDLHGPVALYPSVTVGHLVGALDARQAANFAARCHQLVYGQLTATVDDDGQLSFVEAA